MKFLSIVCLLCALFGLTFAAKDPVCSLPPAVDGNGVIKCAAYVPSWSYDAGSNSCKDFVYGGCGGNANRFGNKEACQAKCVN